MSGGDHERAVIIGAGIAGLAASLALARIGRPSVVLDQRAEIEAEGAGIQIGPNGTRILAALGVLDDLAPDAGVPTAITVRDAGRGGRLAELPLGDWIVGRHGSPYWTLHRRDLHGALIRAVRRAGLVELSTGERVVRLAAGSEDGAITVATEAGRTLQSRIVIGADGVWSQTRRIVTGGELAYTGYQAMRNVVPLGSLPADIEPGRTGLWLSETVHVVHYPVRRGREVAVTIILEGPEPEAGWSLAVADGEIGSLAAGLAPPLAALLRSVSGWRRWGCFALRPEDQARASAAGPIALVGDAAHPILPFLAQGAVLALEDAIVLAEELRQSPDVPSVAFARYRRARRHRVARVAQASRRNGRIYHLSGALGLARDLAFRSLPGERLMGSLDWLYGWRGPETFAVRPSSKAGPAPS